MSLKCPLLKAVWYRGTGKLGIVNCLLLMVDEDFKELRFGSGVNPHVKHENQRLNKHVESVWLLCLDWGSIPHSSTNRLLVIYKELREVSFFYWYIGIVIIRLLSLLTITYDELNLSVFLVLSILSK